MLKHTKLLKNLLKESLSKNKDSDISRIAPGQECILDVRRWESKRDNNIRKRSKRK